MKKILLQDRETILCAWAQPAAGPGWANTPIWFIVRRADGTLQQRCLQPREQSPELRTLYGVSAAIHGEMLAEINRLVRRSN